MLPAINFQDQLGCRAVKINDEVADVFLTVKLDIVQLLPSDPGSEMSLRLGHIFAQFSGQWFDISLKRQSQKQIPP